MVVYPIDILALLLYYIIVERYYTLDWGIYKNGKFNNAERKTVAFKYG